MDMTTKQPLVVACNGHRWSQIPLFFSREFRGKFPSTNLDFRGGISRTSTAALCLIADNANDLPQYCLGMT
jgi:hypothetical protein